MLKDRRQYQVTESALRALPNREGVYVLLHGDSPIHVDWGVLPTSVRGACGENPDATRLLIITQDKTATDMMQRVEKLRMEHGLCEKKRIGFLVEQNGE
jgi:hypothetical protein